MTQFSFGRWPAQLVGSAIGVVLLIRYFYLQNKDLPAGYQFWSFIWYHSVLRAVFEETVKKTLCFSSLYQPSMGNWLFTLTQLITPFLILFAYFMYKNFALEREQPVCKLGRSNSNA